jgi:hypothetical protein
MHDAVLPLAPRTTIFVATAAVADWRPAGHVATRRSRRTAAAGAGDWHDGEPRHPGHGGGLPRSAPWCVGFAAESHDLVRHAREKLQRKGVPLIVGNIGPATFGRDDNALVLVDAAASARWSRAPSSTWRASSCARSPNACRQLRRHDRHRSSRCSTPRMAEHLPQYATPGSAGLDLRACLDAPAVLEPGQAAP